MSTIPCAVPSCRCTIAQARYPGASTYFCQKHWWSVNSRLRKAYGKARKRDDAIAAASIWQRCVEMASAADARRR